MVWKGFEQKNNYFYYNWKKAISRLHCNEMCHLPFPTYLDHILINFHKLQPDFRLNNQLTNWQIKRVLKPSRCPFFSLKNLLSKALSSTSNIRSYNTILVFPTHTQLQTHIPTVKVSDLVPLAQFLIASGVLTDAVCPKSAFCPGWQSICWTNAMKTHIFVWRGIAFQSHTHVSRTADWEKDERPPGRDHGCACAFQSDHQSRPGQVVQTVTAKQKVTNNFDCQWKNIKAENRRQKPTFPAVEESGIKMSGKTQLRTTHPFSLTLAIDNSIGS